MLHGWLQTRVRIYLALKLVPHENYLDSLLPRGMPRGEDIRIAGGKHAAYLATPPSEKAKEFTAVLFLPDIMGIWQNSRLLADEFAANGYLTLLVDTFNGYPLPMNSVVKGEVDIPAWLAGGSTGDNPHNEPAVDPIVKDTIKVLKEEYGVKKLGAVGYCFGAKASSPFHRLLDISQVSKLEERIC